MRPSRLCSCLPNIKAWVGHLAWNNTSMVVHISSLSTVGVEAGWSELEAQGNSLLHSEISDNMEFVVPSQTNRQHWRNEKHEVLKNTRGLSVKKSTHMQTGLLAPPVHSLSHLLCLCGTSPLPILFPLSSCYTRWWRCGNPLFNPEHLTKEALEVRGLRNTSSVAP